MRSAYHWLLWLLLCSWRRHLPMAFRFSEPALTKDGPAVFTIRFCIRCGKVLQGGKGWVRARRNP